VKKFVAFWLLLIMPLTLSGQAADGAVEPKTVELERGQVLELSLLTPVDSTQTRVGDEISFKLERAVIAGGVTVLPENRFVYGRITKVTRAGKNCKSGRVRWKLNPVITPDGRRIKIQPISDFLATRATVSDRVSLDSAGKKIGRTAKYAALAPVIIVTLPFLVLMYIGMRGEGGCDGSDGVEERVPAGKHSYAAVSKGMRLTESRVP
jgi:hypothetical protein